MNYKFIVSAGADERVHSLLPFHMCATSLHEYRIYLFARTEKSQFLFMMDLVFANCALIYSNRHTTLLTGKGGHGEVNEMTTWNLEPWDRT